MTKTMADQVAELMIKREIRKIELLDKEALRLSRKERYFVHGEATPAEDRLALDAEIACLQADQQRSKVELIKLKEQAKAMREAALIKLLMAALKAHGLEHEIEQATLKANDAIRHEGLLQAYTANV